LIKFTDSAFSLIFLHSSKRAVGGVDCGGMGGMGVLGGMREPACPRGVATLYPWLWDLGLGDKNEK